MLRKFWQRITASRRAFDSVAADSPSSRAPLHDAARTERALLEEIARLRAENRALLNSILGIAGIPPIVVSEAEAATEAAVLHAVPPAAVPFRSAAFTPSDARGFQPVNLTLSLRANEEGQPRPGESHRDATNPVAENVPGNLSPAPPRQDKPASPAPKRVRFKSDFRSPRRGAPQQNATAPRRRSWQQINRMLELASARKPTQET